MSKELGKKIVISFTEKILEPTESYGIVSLNKPYTSNAIISQQNSSSGVTNGDVISANYTSAGSGLASYICIDLEGVVDIDKVQIWHYFADGRTYNGTKTEISEDGINWKVIYDSSISGIYAETPIGKTILFEKTKARYIRDWLNGSSANASNHWVEITVYGFSKIFKSEAFTLNGKQYDYVNGPLSDMTYIPSEVKYYSSIENNVYLGEASHDKTVFNNGKLILANVSIYNTLEELLNTTVGMNAKRYNSKNDDGVDSIAGVDWFSFNGSITSTIYVSGNSYIGLGSNSEHLKICSRDGASYYVYTQEGYIGIRRFFKIRFEGYSRYNVTSESLAIRFELFLFSSGSMFLNIIASPTDTSYLGTSTFVSNSGTIPINIIYNQPKPEYFSFYTNGLTWEVKKEFTTEIFANYYPTGKALYTVNDIGKITNYIESKIIWDGDMPDGTSIIVKSSISESLPAEDSFKICNNGSDIPGISVGDDLSSKILYIQVELSTTNEHITPSVKDLYIFIRQNSDNYKILLSFDKNNKFNSVRGPLTVNYNMSKGNIKGRGGNVVSFSRIFTPTDLIPTDYPNSIEYIHVTPNPQTLFSKVHYTDLLYNDENGRVSTTTTCNIVLTNVGEINP